MARAIVLLSGGLDSTVAASLVEGEGLALSFDYSQRHLRELGAARDVAENLGMEHTVLPLPIGELGGSALTDEKIPVADHHDGAIPATYVPARNTVFLSLGLAYAEVADADSVVIGANAIDYSGYPDCRPEFLSAFQAMADLATKRAIEGRRIEIQAPLLSMTKADIVRAGIESNAPMHLTWSCYRGEERPCGTCDSCILRKRGFKEAGVPDKALEAMHGA